MTRIIDFQGTLQFRRGTSGEWQVQNPILAEGEMGVELDTKRYKLGDGIRPWNSLVYGGPKGDAGPRGLKGEPGPMGTVTPEVQMLADQAAASAANAQGSADQAAATLNGTVKKAELAANTGAGMVGVSLGAAGAVDRTLSDKLKDTVCVFDFMSLSQINDVRNRTGSIDVSGAIQSAINASYTVVFPPGVYSIASQIILPKTRIIRIKGDGFSSEVKASATMVSMFWKDGLDAGGDRSSVIFDDILLNANRKANYCLRIGSSKAGAIRNVKLFSYLIAGLRGGDDSGIVQARYYENDISHVISDGDASYASDVNLMPTNGIILTNNGTDNVLDSCVVSYVKDAALEIQGAGNQIKSPHAYGDNAAGTGPKYTVHISAQGEIVSPYSDNITVAGVKISSSTVNVIGGTYYWASDNVPAANGAVPIEIDGGVDTITIMGGYARNMNTSNPFIRYLGTKPQRITVLGVSPPLPGTNDIAVNTVERNFGVSRHPTQASKMVLDTAPATASAHEFRVNGGLRFYMGTDGSVESGSDAGSNFVFYGVKDGGAASQLLKIYRNVNQWEFGDRVKLGGTHVGFYGTSPITKQTISGSRGGNAALADLLTKLSSLGLVVDSTTA